MKTASTILTMQLIATMKILIVYLGISYFNAYFNLLNSMMIILYTVLFSAIILNFLKGQFDGRKRTKN